MSCDVIEVLLLDTQTGYTRWIRVPGFDARWWSEGNGSCDCNREILLYGYHPDHRGRCLGCRHFLIIDSKPKLNLAEFNQDYPEELLKTYGVIPTDSAV